MRVYLGKDRTYTTDTITVTHTTVVGLMRRVENVGQKIYMDSFFSSPDLYDDLHIEKQIYVTLSDSIKKACHRNLGRL
jgi:hypothetical protein